MQAKLIEAVQTVASDRHRLVILLGDFGAGKTAVLRDASAEVGGVYLNLNLVLTERLLSIPSKRYADGVTVHGLIDDICDQASPEGQPLFVDNLEILFSPELGKINPVDTFKRVARQRVVVIALPARRHGNSAEYSAIGREDHMLMSIEGYPILEMKPE